MSLTWAQGQIVDNLTTAVDRASVDALEQVVTAANAISDNQGDELADISTIQANVAAADTLEGKQAAANEEGALYLEGKTASLSGTGGIALLEFFKDKVSNIASVLSGMGTLESQVRKVVERRTQQ